MSDLVKQMLKDVLDAYVKQNTVLADNVRERDNEVDHMHNSLFRELLTYTMEDPRSITPALHLLFIAKNIERMGDHATSIAEQVHYISCGEFIEDERSKSDKTSSMV